MKDDFRVDSIDHVELNVPDRGEAAAWYRDVLGLQIMSDYVDWSEAAGGPLMISPDGGATKLALFAGTPQSADRPIGFVRLAFRTSGAGFRRFLDRLESMNLTAEHGGRLTARHLVDHGQALSVYFRDPWGNRLELTTYEPGVARAPASPR